jgi:hypothetical protein
MNKKIKKVEYKKLLEILDEYDVGATFEKINVIPESTDLYEKISEYINVKSFSRKSVLGIDIYRYGLYKHLEQTLIPAVFKLLFEKTIRLCLENNQFVFQHYNRDIIENSFISTGDGGFLIFDTPMHALFFAINFESLIRSYNAYHHYPKLRDITGSLSLRYAITYDTIFSFENNFFGTAIINNARILEKDTLNRCLIDQNTYDWFLINIDGIENLQVLTIYELANIYDFQDYDVKYIEEGNNEIITSKVSRFEGVINSDVSKIGQIRSKEINLNIYNIHLQITINAFADAKKHIKRTITMSLGNLNTAGI